MYAFQLSDYAKSIISSYHITRPVTLTTSIGFTGAASERVTVYTPKLDSPVLLLDVNVDFSNSSVLVKITDSGSGYSWNAVNTPIQALAGTSGSYLPVLPLPIEYLLKEQTTLQMDFINSSLSPTTGGNITWRGIRLQQQV
jgi:hypothetical protein